MWRRRPLVQVVGAFRSGTNATKTCLERFYHVEVVFNRWFWKHGLPPAELNHPLPQSVPVLLLSRDPVTWALAMHRFWRERRPELNVPGLFSDFLRQPLIVYDNTGKSCRPRFFFSSPIDYWNRYYYSWLSWGDLQPQLHCLRCEDLVADADAWLAPLAQVARWRLREPGPLVLPRERVGPKVSPAQVDERVLLTAEDRDWIEAAMDRKIVTRLGYERKEGGA